MVLEIPAGLFVLINLVAVAGFIVTVKFKFGIVLILSFVLFAGLAVWFIGGDQINGPNVVSVKNVYNATGGLTGSEKDVWIDSNQATIGSIYFLAAGVALTWFLKIIVDMIQKRKISASGYWT